ncbi:MAG TPA: hypothetical protein VF339_04075 [Gammaproteobacteria bacterium]
MESAGSASAVPDLGDLLEISISVDEPAAALATFRSLGLREVSVTDFAPGPLAVVTDGHLALGLYAAERDVDGPTPTFVRPNLRAHVPAIEAAGIEILEADLGDDSFHRAAFGDPNDLRAVLLEARTFAPVEPESGLVPACGRFVELSVATHSLDESTSFWTTLGFSVVAEHDSPHPSRRLEGHGLSLGFHETGRFRTALTFAAPQLDARVEYLRAKGFAPRTSSPLTGGDARSATLVVPGRIPFFLLEADDEG